MAFREVGNMLNETNKSNINANDREALEGINSLNGKFSNYYTKNELDQKLKENGGKSAYEIAVENGFVGTEQEWLNSFEVIEGKSAYQVWLDAGNVGTEQDYFDSQAEGVLNTVRPEIINKNSVNILDYQHLKVGEDWTPALKSAMDTGKKVYLPSSASPYTLLGTISNTNIYLYGDGYNSCEIKTSASVVFDKATSGEITGIKFKSNTVNSNTLFTNTNKNTFSSDIYRCRFDDYNIVFDFPDFANDVRMDQCFFYKGNIGLKLNYAHTSAITRCTFWQQYQYSAIIERGTGSYMKGCHFAGTQGRPATLKLYSSTWTIENNYMEGYPSTGSNNDAWIVVEFNNVSTLPIIRENLIHGKDIYDNGIKLSNVLGTTFVNNEVLSITKNTINGVLNKINYTPTFFSKLDIVDNTGVSNTNYQLDKKQDLVTTITWIDATLQNGFTGSVKYFKDGNNIVTIKFDITIGSTNAINTVVATLPDGYYPTNLYTPVPAFNMSTGTSELAFNVGANFKALTLSKALTTNHRYQGQYTFRVL
ncbi:hypothetical protein ETI08_03455 [Macrococcoides goetzii]|nr:hypothetical protein [Macrococcus goetzii]TDM48208.1 hypothetical protein ETI08_03455 [Macrococcus goetzii]